MVGVEVVSFSRGTVHRPGLCTLLIMPRGRNRFSSLRRGGSYGSSSRTMRTGYENREEDEDEELSRKLSFCIHSYRAVGSSNVSTRSLQRIRRELKENNPKEKEMREDKEDYLQHKLSIQHQMQRLEEKVRGLAFSEQEEEKKKGADFVLLQYLSLLFSRRSSGRGTTPSARATSRSFGSEGCSSRAGSGWAR